MFIRYEQLGPKNCAVQSVRFVKSVTRRPKEANVSVAGDLIIQAHVHSFSDRHRKWRDHTESFATKPSCYGYCSASHLTLYIKNDKMFRIGKSGPKEFKNYWLLNHIMKNVFKEKS